MRIGKLGRLGPEIILERLKAFAASEQCTISFECYPGVFEKVLIRTLVEGLQPSGLIITSDLLKSPSEIRAVGIECIEGDDPVFGQMNSLEIEDFFDGAKLGLRHAKRSKTGTMGFWSLSALAHDHFTFGQTTKSAGVRHWIWLDGRSSSVNMTECGREFGCRQSEWGYPRTEIQTCVFCRLAVAADHSQGNHSMQKIDFWLDTNGEIPKLVTGRAVRDGLSQLVRRPFRVVPYFDPGPWGGHWMEEVCGLPIGTPNYAWCFDCVPEENSLLLAFGGTCVEIPTMNLTLLYPRELLGDAVVLLDSVPSSRFRFDFLDTMGGGNLSLQVHPKTQFIRVSHFGMGYTQDESYYLLDAGDDGSVYLGLKTDFDRETMIRELKAAQDDGVSFYAETYVNQPSRRESTTISLIPAGTIHCSGRNSMILEISATPYIFTFKLWDWSRLGLNGLPRPIHLEYGLANIVWNRDTEWVGKNLINRIKPMGEGPGWREERTGLHELEFIGNAQAPRFTSSTPHDSLGTVNVCLQPR